MYFIILLVLVIVCVYLFARKQISKHLSFILSNKAIIITSISFLLFGIFCSLLYLKYDSTGYEYGLNCNFCNKQIPYNLIPQSDRYGSFTLNDEEGFELIGIGFKYKKSSFVIKNFLAYGYIDTSIIVKCTDSLNNLKYLVSYEIRYKNNNGKPIISFKDLENNMYNQIKSNYRWIEINQEKTNTIQFMKFILIIGVTLSLFFSFQKFFQSWRKVRGVKRIKIE